MDKVTKDPGVASRAQVCLKSGGESVTSLELLEPRQTAAVD